MRENRQRQEQPQVLRLAPSRIAQDDNFVERAER